MAYTLNDLEAVSAVLIKEGMLRLRANAIMARLCRFDVKQEMSMKNRSVDVVLPINITAQEVNVSTGNAPTVIEPEVVQIKLDKWYEAKFGFSDKDVSEMMNGVFPESAAGAIDSLATKVDVSLLELGLDLFACYGTPGTTPSAMADIAGVGRVLDDNNVPILNRVGVINPAANEKFIQLGDFIDASKYGSPIVGITGQLGRKLGIDWAMDQNLSKFTKGTLTAANAIAAKEIEPVGETEIVLNDSGGSSLSGTIKRGDILTFAGDVKDDGSSNTYVVTAAATASGNEVTATIYPGLKKATADGTVVTMKGSGVSNLVFNPSAFCFASRQLEAPAGLGSIISSAVDPVSGITLRLEIYRDPNTKQVVYCYDILWGAKTIHRERGARLFG